MRIPAQGAAPVRLLLGSFLGLIALGTLLLKLPFATPPGAGIGWVDALFTATSATCVTGLVVRDTGAGFTPFGHGVILLLIQLGGLGVMTFWLFIYWLVRGRVSLAFRSVFERTLSPAGGDRFAPLLRLVFFFTILCEAAGALLLFIAWVPRLGVGRALYHGVFHAVSAFCNAGFALYPDSLVRYAADPFTNLTIMALIVLGGLGFFTVFEVATVGLRPRRWSVHTKLALVVTAVLVILGAVLFWFLEGGHSMAALGPGRKFLVSVFQSVTARTAGFNTIDFSALWPGTLFMLSLLMFIGGSPGSCAGGIKTTTVGVMALTVWARYQGHENVNAFRRSLDGGTLTAAVSVTAGGVLVALVGLFAVLVAQQATLDPTVREPGFFLASFFETVSAVGTVGLSTGITGELTPPARLVVVLLMFVGRLGPLTVATALALPRPSHDWEYPREGVMVG